MTYFDSNKRAKIMYRKVYSGIQIAKYRGAEAGDEPGDLNYIPRNEREERITRVGFKLDDVITWNECNEDFNTYFDKRPKIIVELRGASDIVLIEDFNNFSFMMELYFESQENPFITMGKN